MSRQDDFLRIMSMFSGQTKVAQGGMEQMGAPIPPMGPGAMPPMMDPYMMMPPPPEAQLAGMGMMPPPAEGPVPTGKNENDVAIKAMDLAAKTIELALAEGEKEPEQMSDEAAAIMASSKALDEIPAEEIAAMAANGGPVDQAPGEGQPGQPTL
jgi:hypothetical protein